MFLEVWGGQGRFLEVQKALFIIVVIKKLAFYIKIVNLDLKWSRNRLQDHFFDFCGHESKALDES